VIRFILDLRKVGIVCLADKPSMIAAAMRLLGAETGSNLPLGVAAVPSELAHIGTRRTRRECRLHPAPLTRRPKDWRYLSCWSEIGKSR